MVVQVCVFVCVCVREREREREGGVVGVGLGVFICVCVFARACNGLAESPIQRHDSCACVCVCVCVCVRGVYLLLHTPLLFFFCGDCCYSDQ